MRSSVMNVEGMVEMGSVRLRLAHRVNKSGTGGRALLRKRRRMERGRKPLVNVPEVVQ